MIVAIRATRQVVIFELAWMTPIIIFEMSFIRELFFVTNSRKTRAKFVSHTEQEE